MQVLLGQLICTIINNIYFLFEKTKTILFIYKNKLIQIIKLNGIYK